MRRGANCVAVDMLQYECHFERDQRILYCKMPLAVSLRKNSLVCKDPTFTEITEASVGESKAESVLLLC